MSELLRRRNVQVVTDLERSELLADFDRDRLIQVVINLISNAAKFSDPVDPRVWVVLERSGQEALVSVRDNGPGVPPEHREVIFDKFQQVTDVDAGKPRGTGLGLPISREIIDQMGGRLWIETGVGPGAVFCFALPLATTPPTSGGGDGVERSSADS